MSTEKQNETRFLNVDLDIQCMSGLENLLNFLNSHVYVLFNDEKNASVELNIEYRSLDETLQGFVELIKSLPQQSANIWNHCEKRVFNIGIQGGINLMKHFSSFHIKHFLCSQAFRLKFRLQCMLHSGRDVFVHPIFKEVDSASAHDSIASLLKALTISSKVSISSH